VLALCAACSSTPSTARSTSTTAVPTSTTRAPSTTTSTAPGTTEHEVAPTTVDPGAEGPDDLNIAMVGPSAGWNGQLVVFLPGSGGQPSCCTLFLQEAARLGFHAIGLTYNNATAIGTRCEDDLACYGTARRNVFDGTDPGSDSAVALEDGIEHRLAALLSYLVQRYPAEGWATFLSGSLPAYGSIVLTGHSQGGGEAAFIATERAARGVVTLSSPPDTNRSHVAAPWLSTVATGATPLDRYYAFVHTGDPFSARIRADWTAMGLDGLGPLELVDGAESPFAMSHELSSSAPLPPVVLATHDSTAVDGAQPRCADGSSEYTVVWRYLLDSAAGLPLGPPEAACSSA